VPRWRVGDAGGDPHLLAHRGRRSAEGRRLLHVEALGEEHRPQPDPLGVPHLGEQLAGVIDMSSQAVAGQLHHAFGFAIPRVYRMP